MKALVIGDPHFKQNNSHDMTLMIDQLVNIATDKQPDVIIVLGDVLDRHDIIHMSPLCQAVHFLKQLQDISPLIVLIGNHDRKNNKVFLTHEHPFTALQSWSNTTIIDTPQVITIKNIKMTFVPYVEPGRFSEALSLVDATGSILFCHQEFKGAQMGAITSIHGDEWHENFIISGHIHDYQVLNNILYLGTPIQHAYSDGEKYVGLFTFNKVIYHYDELQWEKIQLNLPLKKIIHLTCKQLKTFKLPDHIQAKIVVKGSLSEIKKCMKLNLDLKKQAKIVYVDNSLPTKVEATTEKFATLLVQQIKTPSVMNVYTELFGELKK